MVRRGRSVQVLFAAAATVLVMAAAAWACTSQPRIFALSSQEAPVGSEVRVTGQTVAPQGEVEVRWNDVEGPVLATTAADGNGSFSTVVRIPETAPGVYTILAVAGGEGVARSAVEVIQPLAQAPSVKVPLPADLGDSAWRTLPGDAGPSSEQPASSRLALAAGLSLVAASFAGFSMAAVIGLRRRPGTISRR